MNARTVQHAMTSGPISVRPDAPLAEAARVLDACHIRGVPVIDRDGRLVGVLSQTDLLRARAIDHLWSTLPGLAVRHLMTTPAVTASATMTLDDAAALMEERRIHRLVVVAPDGRTPIGILSVSDVIHDMARR